MSKQNPITPLLLALVAGAIASACLPSGDGGGTGRPTGHGTVEVSLAVREPVSGLGTNYVATQPLAHIGTSLIIAVPDGTNSPSRFEQIAAEDNIAQALLNLDTSSVTFELPLDTPLQLFEYTFNDVLTLNGILADTPVAGPPDISNSFTITDSDTDIQIRLPIETTTFTSDFGGNLSKVRWEQADSGADSGGGRLAMTADGAFTAGSSVTQMRQGKRTGVRTNRNLLLANQRVSGTIGISDFATVNSSDTSGQDANPNLSGPTQVRVVGGQLDYRPRSQRGKASSEGLTGVRIRFDVRTGGSISASLDAFSCSGTSTCSDHPTDLFINAPFSTTFDAATLADQEYPFSVEYLGGGLFQGTFNGETVLLNVFTQPLGQAYYAAHPSYVFTRNDFVQVEARSGVENLWDDGDSGQVTANWKNVTVGGKGPDAPTGTGTRLADSLVLFDDFSLGRIDPAKWDVGDLDFALEVRNGALVARANGRTGVAGAYFADPNAVTDFSADVRIDGIHATGAFPEPSAHLFGSFFKDANGGANDRTGDIEAVLFVRDTDDFQGAYWEVFRCNDPTCDFRPTIASATWTVPSYATGQTINLRIQYDGSTMLTFSAGGTSEVVELSSLGVNFGGAPADSYKNVGVESNYANDAVVATIDNVTVNGALFDDFSAAQLDPTKWANGELVREVQGGELVMVHSKTAAVSSSLSLDVTNRTLINAIAADVTATAIDPGTASNPGDAQARLHGEWYNDGRGGSGDITGDAIAVVRLREFTAEWGIFVCENSTCLGSGNNLPLTNPSWNTLGVVEPGTTHTLYAAWDDNDHVATFQLDDLPAATYRPESNGYAVAGPAIAPSKRLRTRVSNNGVSLSATVDNVRLGAALPAVLADSLPTFEDFSGGYDLSKWQEGGDFTLGILSSQLQINLPGQGGLESRAELVLSNSPSKARGLAADVTLTDLTSVDFGGGEVCSRLFADASGNTVEGCIGLEDSGSVGYNVQLCPPNGEGNCQNLDSGTFPGSVGLGTAVHIGVYWSPGSSVLHFVAEVPQGTPQPPLDFDASSVGHPYASELQGDEYYLALAGHAKFQTDPSRFTAVFDNVEVDTAGSGTFAAYDTFSTSTIDQAKWRTGEKSRLVGGGQMDVSQVNDSVELGVTANVAVGAAAADVTVSQTTGAGDAYLLRLIYGDSAGRLVLGVIGMTASEAFAGVARVDETAGTLEILHMESLATGLAAGPHTLFQQWDGNKLTYQLDGQPYRTVDPTAFASIAIADVIEPFMVLSVGNLNINATAEQNAFTTGSSTATFQNVRVGGVLPIP